jgi:predicted cobalt transporter CbtA
MARSLLVRGMLAGLLAGLVAFAVAWIFGEGPVAQAIDFEGMMAAHEATAGAAEEPELVSRDVQSSVGLLTATLIYGVGIGGIFALVFAALSGRVGNIGARALSGLLALGAFVVVGLVPFLKYPPNPPAVGDGDTIERRTTLFLAMVAISVLLAVLAVIAGRRLAPRLGPWNATIVAVLGFVVVIAVVQQLLPDINEVGAGFPATTLYDFRAASLAVQASVWATLGLAFGALAERGLTPRAAAPSQVPVTSSAG